MFLWKRKLIGYCLIFYRIGRLVLEFFRGDLIRGSVGMLSLFISYLNLKP